MTSKAEKAADAVLERIKIPVGNKTFIIAIDGRCASGKTTLTEALMKKTGCNVIHADHFFLRKEQRTRQRLEQAGGNIDYERIRDEVLVPLKREGTCSYRKFDCKSMSLCDEVITVGYNALTVVEGSYSCHPDLWEYYDFRVFLSVVQGEQLERIRKRNGDEAALVFQKRWIPLEEKYFDAYRISERCDLTVDTSSDILDNNI